MLNLKTKIECGFNLDNPVLASLRSHWDPHTTRHGRATALAEDLGPFVAIGGPRAQDQADFVSLLKKRKSPSVLLQVKKPSIPTTVEQLMSAKGVQMTHSRATRPFQRFKFLKLEPKDGPDILKLARLTKPGPFERNTHLLGDFIGIRERGRLVAMVGQRMSFPGWIEISGVCVHPNYRGRGMAQSLVATMIDRIGRGGARPFLHTFADNTAAIELYRGLGFEIRSDVNFTQVAAKQVGY